MTAAVTVRAGDETDFPWVVAVTREAFGDEWQATSQRGLFLVTDLPILVAEAGGQPCGFLAWEIVGEVCETVVLVASPPGAGSGRALMEAVHRLAVDRHCGQLRVVTTDDNTRARGFYEHLGYEVAEIREGAVEECRRRFKPHLPPGPRDEVEYRLAVRP